MLFSRSASSLSLAVQRRCQAVSAVHLHWLDYIYLLIAVYNKNVRKASEKKYYYSFELYLRVTTVRQLPKII